MQTALETSIYDNFRVTTLLRIIEIMKQVHLDRFMLWSSHFGMLLAYRSLPGGSELLTNDAKMGHLDIATNVEKECRALELPMSAKTAQKIIQLVSGPFAHTTTYKELNDLIAELETRLREEMESRLFLCVKAAQVKLFSERNLFGEDVTDRFPSAIIDTEEGGKCFAFDRYTACAFHLMRIMEVGLRAVAKALNVPSSIPSWDGIIKKCDAELQKPRNQQSADIQGKEEFYGGVLATLQGVKTAWRNPTMHVEKTYTEEQASDMWNSVKSFMRHIATELRE